MKYSEAKALIKTGDVFSCEGTAFYSKIINIVTRSPISHVGIAIWIQFPGDLEDQLCIIESHAMLGVRIAPMDVVIDKDYWQRGGKVNWQAITDSRLNGDRIVSNALKRWTKSYASWYQFLILGSFFIKTVRYLLNKPMDSDKNGQHCSELVTRAFVEDGYRHGNDPSITTPADVSAFSCLAEPVVLEKD